MQLRKGMRLRFKRIIGTSTLHSSKGILPTSLRPNLPVVKCSNSSSSSSQLWLSTTTATVTEKYDFIPDGPCRVLEWAAMSDNRAVASECLNAPSLPPTPMSDDASTINGIQNWEEYWKYRQWNFPDTLKDDTEREYGRALASHIMTAPMTIYSMLDPLLEARTKVTTSTKQVTNAFRNNKEKNATMKVRWCIIGARSEASLPIQYWQEMIDMIHAARRLAYHKYMIDIKNSSSTNSRQHSNKKNISIVPKLLDITLDFIGPEMNLRPSVELHPSNTLRHDEYDFVGDGATTNIFTTCTLQWRYKGLYHTHYDEINEQEDAYDKQYDAYILFNPGIGHPYLQKLWQPTLQLLFEQYYGIRNTLNGGCTILLTSHSMTDALRDSELLQHYLLFANASKTNPHVVTATPKAANMEENESTNTPNAVVEEETISYYTENPFASRIYYHDPIVQQQESSKSPHIVRPNHYVSLVRRR